MRMQTGAAKADDEVLALYGSAIADTTLPPALREHATGSAPVLLPTLGHLPQAWLLLIPAVAGLVQLRRRAGAAAGLLRGQNLRRVALDLGDLARDSQEIFLAGMAQGSYSFDRYRPGPKQKALRLRLRQALPAAGSKRTAAVLEATAACRDLINTPARDCGPADFVAAAKALCKGTGLRLTVWDAPRLRKEGCDCIHTVGVAAGKGRAPRLLMIDWPGSKAAGKPLALCGKGVCFDTGGLQIKPGKSMELMRKDMGGAATVLAAMLVHARSKSRRAVRAYLPLVENAIAGDAFRPGDVLTAADGTTIEVGHTDAEGRLVLADALSIAYRDGARALVTVATLTGAAMVALGRIHVPLMATDDALADGLQAAAQSCGEKMWRLPLDEDHHALVRASRLATLTNSAGPEASCITAGAFLAHFAKDRPFAHLDISPASWKDGNHELGPAGATGVMVDTLARFIAEA